MSSLARDQVHSELQSGAVDAAIERAIAFLGHMQLPHGEFRTMLASKPDMADAVYDASPFATTFVLHALSFARSPSVAPMQKAALRFIASEMQTGGLWRYFSRLQYKHCRIPPDLDDTACSSFALKSYGRRPPWNKWIFRACRDEQGRFLTWVLPKPSASRLSPLRLVLALVDWQGERARRRTQRPAVPSHPYLFLIDHDPVPEDDTDPVVNANVVLYLGENSSTCAAIQWIIEELKAHRNTSAYYDDMLAFYYMVARAHSLSCPTLGAARKPILEGMASLRKPDGSFGSVLSTALAVSTLLTYAPQSPDIETAIQAILIAQLPDGGWTSEPFYSGPSMYWGSRELTTAFCLEALLRHQAGTPRDRARSELRHAAA